MDVAWATLGGIGGLVACLVGLIAALRTGVLASGAELVRLQTGQSAELARLEKAHAEDIERLRDLFVGTIEYERKTTAEWRASAHQAQEALDVALETNRTWARQAELAAVSADLTNRVLETVRQKVIGT